MKKITVNVLILVFLALVINVQAQSGDRRLWNNHKCAVALTYDDGLNVHLDHAIPVLDSLGFKATFYVPGNSASLAKRLDEWKMIASNGHELGNHTLFHPCVGKSKGRGWVTQDYDLDNYSIRKITDEIRVASTLLKAVDDKSRRTYAYTCGDDAVREMLFTDSIRNDFVSARGGTTLFNKLNNTDLFYIGAFCVNGNTADELIALVNKAIESESFLVFMFHGVGGEHDLNVSNDDHRKLLSFLKEHEEDVWISPFIDVSEYIRSSGKLRR